MAIVILFFNEFLPCSKCLHVRIFLEFFDSLLNLVHPFAEVFGLCPKRGEFLLASRSDRRGKPTIVSRTYRLRRKGRNGRNRLRSPSEPASITSAESESAATTSTEPSTESATAATDHVTGN